MAVGSLVPAVTFESVTGFAITFPGCLVTARLS